MSFLERYHQFRDKQKFIERLKENQSKMGTQTATMPKTIKVLEKVFKDNHIRSNNHDLERARDIVHKCQQDSLSAFKAADTICIELDIESRINRTLIEQALINNRIINN